MKKDKITFVSPPHERTDKLDFEHKPTNDQEFYDLVNNAPWNILKGFGFRKWETMNNVIKENVDTKDRPKIINLPTYDLEGVANALLDKEAKPTGNITIDISSKEPIPMELLAVDQDIILFPGEWYDIIPNGFMVIGLSGETYPFLRGKSDNDIRFGCLPYGITRPTPSTKDSINSK